ncbi:MAG: radical SAM protein, partial [Bacteroidia bacterium]|nr:radical SAM protein [Bacteroidia bacterium]
MRNRIKQRVERWLLGLSDRNADVIGNQATKLKKRWRGAFAFSSIGIFLHKFFDFVIVRTNGNRFIEFELSNICNARCVFCPYPEMLRTDKKFMHMKHETLMHIKEDLVRFKGALVSFTPTTGDTLLHPEWYTYMAEILNETSIGRATMFTNAIELDSER